jgi:hypothetical protein
VPVPALQLMPQGAGESRCAAGRAESRRRGALPVPSPSGGGGTGVIHRWRTAGDDGDPGVLERLRDYAVLSAHSGECETGVAVLTAVPTTTVCGCRVKPARTSEASQPEVCTGPTYVHTVHSDNIACSRHLGHDDGCGRSGFDAIGVDGEHATFFTLRELAANILGACGWVVKSFPAALLL